jgi:hypothetical protein
MVDPLPPIGLPNNGRWLRTLSAIASPPRQDPDTEHGADRDSRDPTPSVDRLGVAG